MSKISKLQNAVVATEDVDRDKAAGEFMFLGLRMTEGIRVRKFIDRFGRTPVQRFPKIRDWIAGGLMEESAGRLRLTPKGLLVANSLFVEFM
jgi:oxygen-independent coproporphyrinogen-3 oxidase